MEKYTRKILSNRVITSIDTDGDGQDDAITLMPLTPVNIQFFLKEDIDNMGLFTDFVEEAEVIDIDNVWDLTNDGSGDGGTMIVNTGLTNPYDDDNVISQTEGILPAYCVDENAQGCPSCNYVDPATLPNGLAGQWNGSDPIDPALHFWMACTDCCIYPGDVVGGATSEVGGIIDSWTGSTGNIYKLKCFSGHKTSVNCSNDWNSVTPFTEGSPNHFWEAESRASEYCDSLIDDGAVAGEWTLLKHVGVDNAPLSTANGCCFNPPIDNTVFGGPRPDKWELVDDRSTCDGAPYMCLGDMTYSAWVDFRDKIQDLNPNQYKTTDCINVNCDNNATFSRGGKNHIYWCGTNPICPGNNSIMFTPPCTETPYEMSTNTYCPSDGCTDVSTYQVGGDCGGKISIPWVDSSWFNNRCGRKGIAINGYFGRKIKIPKVTAHVGQWEFCFTCKRQIN